MNFSNKTVFITGASRGIGFEIAKKMASLGANVVIAAKTATPHPKLPGTVFSAAEEIERIGGRALPLVLDIRDENHVFEAVEKAVETFGGIDILVNNASAISLTGTLWTDMKKYDLMHQVNARGTFLTSKACLPHLLKAENPHVLTLSPPLNIEARWFENHVAYSMAKFGMSLCTLGMAAEFKNKVAFNSLWPKTIIATAAIEFAVGNADMLDKARKPSIMADAAYEIFKQDHKTTTGQFFIDEEVLKAANYTDFDVYKVNPALGDHELIPDFFI
ncbi:SDR family oxidoreductase [Aquirufa rosea]|uniref:NAD(P)-dependent oxidoreductase n=1 Tax=Aquirufa rosea TaxID=2509241 RepID=A0A4Q1C133_9BACT|nr:NAD(P)-dependent oxidoreductase [Aquirufa rosea]RXK50816.1 NAD(P)-dependent oxidoreductase [Aquirufa rosea]